jgi:hypothetical protein
MAAGRSSGADDARRQQGSRWVRAWLTLDSGRGRRRPRRVGLPTVVQIRPPMGATGRTPSGRASGRRAPHWPSARRLSPSLTRERPSGVGTPREVDPGGRARDARAPK